MVVGSTRPGAGTTGGIVLERCTNAVDTGTTVAAVVPVSRPGRAERRSAGEHAFLGFYTKTRAGKFPVVPAGREGAAVSGWYVLDQRRPASLSRDHGQDVADAAFRAA